MKLEPLDPTVAALLASEREVPRVADDGIERALEQAMAKGQALLTTAPPGLGTPAAKAFGWKALAAAAAGGAVVGSLATYAVIGPSHEPAPAPSQVAPLPAETAAPPIASATPVPAPASAATPGESATAPPRGSAEPVRPAPNDIARERELVDAARAALAKGNVAEASRLLREHDSQFPRGQLGEEREALQIVALARGGKKDEARARLASFKRSHPSSPLLPMLEGEAGGGDAGP